MLPSRSGPRPLALALGCAVLAAAVLGAYGNTFAVPFVFDDLPAIANNPSIRSWLTALNPPGSGTTVTGRPFLNLSFAANYAAGGLGLGGFHATNLAIHLLAALTLYGIARRTLRSCRAPRPEPTAFAIALIWGVHPLDTESVTYLVQRAESLMGLCYLLTLYCFIRGTESGARRPRTWLAGSALACLTGMATKEVMVSAPVMVLFYDRTFVSGSFREAWRRHRWTFAALGATWIPLGLLVAGAHNRGGTAGFGVGVSWGKYALTQFPAIVHYLTLAAWPRPLIFDYGAQWTERVSAAILPFLLVAALAGATLWALGRRGAGASGVRALGFLGLWFFAILAPTSLVPGMRQTAAEHRMYLALIPLVAAAAGALAFHGRRHARLCGAIGVTIAAVYGGLTFRRNQDYRSALALWTATAAELPENPFAHNNRGIALQEAGRIAEAAGEFQTALQRKPDYADAENNWGSALLATGQFEAAAVHLEAAVRMDGEYAAARSNLGATLAKLGRPEEAAAQFLEALRLAPDSPRIHANYGKLLFQINQLPVAEAEYETALRLDPENAEAHFGLGMTWQRRNQNEAAQREYEAAVRWNPGYAEAHNNWGMLLAQSGRLPEALAHFAAAARLQPANAGFRANLGMALAQSGRAREAIPELRAALAINPGMSGVERVLRHLESL